MNDQPHSHARGAISVLLVDDHAIVREGYRSLLQKQPGLKVAGEADDGISAYRLYKELSPDIVIMDLSMQGVGGIEAIRRIRGWDANARILVFTMHDNSAFATQALRAGAKGYVTKSSAPVVLIEAIYDVLKGRRALSPDISHALALTYLNDEPRVLDVLTPREFEILRMLVAEKSTAEIAETLCLSPKTVANAHYLIKSKLGVASDIELVHMVFRQNVFADPPIDGMSTVHE